MILTILKLFHYLFAGLTLWYICEGIYYIFKMNSEEAKGAFSLFLMSLIGTLISGILV